MLLSRRAVLRVVLAESENIEGGGSADYRGWRCSSGRIGSRRERGLLKSSPDFPVIMKISMPHFSFRITTNGLILSSF